MIFLLWKNFLERFCVVLVSTSRSGEYFMKAPIRSKLVLSLASLLLVAAAIVIPLSSSILPSHAQRAQNISPARVNPIVAENKKTGTTSWKSKELSQYAASNVTNPDTDSSISRENKISNRAVTTKTWTDTSLRGYANTTSINHGDTINFYVGTTLPNYSIQVYRMGWYGGAGSRLIQTISNLPGQNQPVPPADPNTQLLQLNWNVSYTLQTDATWVTGAFLAKLIGSDGSVWYIPFVIRDDSSTADILFQLPVNTYQAYNV